MTDHRLFRLSCLIALCACSSHGPTDAARAEAPSTWIRTDAATYSTDDTVRVSITNVGAVALIHGGPCGAFLEEWTGDRWADSPQQPIAGQACASPEFSLAPTVTFTVSLPLGSSNQGLFRFRFDDLNRSVEPALPADQRRTNAFRIQ